MPNLSASHAIQSSSLQLNDWLFRAALPLWWEKGGDRAAGGFHELLDLDGAPVAQPRRARVQARQSYVYATAGRMGWQGPWQDAARHGLAYLAAHYRADGGEFATLLSADGKIADPTAMLYDQAFALMAMATVFSVLRGQIALKDDALALARHVTKSRRQANGGFVESGARPFQSNAHMHLFEASLAWCESAPEPLWSDLADEIGALCLSRFIDPQGGFLREFFDGGWTPASGVDGRIVEPGHQFEWAWLLERWGRMRGRSDARAAARRLFAAGMRGIDRTRKVAVDELSETLGLARPTARLWPQTERMKSALILAEAEERDAKDRYLREAAEAAEGLQLYLDTPVEGLWRDKMREDGSFVEEPAPASSFYHIICAIQALSETAQRL